MSLLRNIDKFLYWDERRQMYVPHYWRKEVLPYWLGPDISNRQVAANGVITVNAAGASTPPVAFKQFYSSVEGLDQNLGNPLEIRSLVFEDSTDTTAAAAFTVRMEEQGERREFMNNPIHVRTMFGTAQTPYILREPYFFPSQHNLSITYNKIAAGATTMRMFFAGAQYYPWSPEYLRKPQNRDIMVNLIKRWMERRKYVSPYWLTTDQDATVGANATADFFMKVGDDGSFEGFTLTQVSTGAFEYEISEPKTQQTIMNGFATAANSLGTALFPTLLPTPYLVPAGYRLRLRITDLSGAPNQIWFTIGGRKIFAPFKDIGDIQQDLSIPTPGDTPSQIVPAPLV